MKKLVIGLAALGLIVATGSGWAGDKVDVCHNDNNPHTINISVNAVPAHVPGHPGDYLGPCRVVPPPCQHCP